MFFFKKALITNWTSIDWSEFTGPSKVIIKSMSTNKCMYRILKERTYLDQIDLEVMRTNLMIASMQYDEIAEKKKKHYSDYITVTYVSLQFIAIISVKLHKICYPTEIL